MVAMVDERPMVSPHPNRENVGVSHTSTLERLNAFGVRRCVLGRLSGGTALALEGVGGHASRKRVVVRFARCLFCNDWKLCVALSESRDVRASVSH